MSLPEMKAWCRGSTFQEDSLTHSSSLRKTSQISWNSPVKAEISIQLRIPEMVKRLLDTNRPVQREDDGAFWSQIMDISALPIKLYLKRIAATTATKHDSEYLLFCV